MRIKRKNLQRFLASLIVFTMIFTSVNIGIFSKSKAFAIENSKEEKNTNEENNITLNQVINGIIEYYNNVHFIENQGQLNGYECSGLYRAGADFKKKNWFLNYKYETKFDKNCDYFGSKIHQSFILLDYDKDPSNYEGRNLIEEIAKEVNENNSYFRQTDMKAVMALDLYNEKYSNKKIEYNINHAVEQILKAQCDDGGFKERKGSVPLNTGIALNTLSKHKDIEGVNEAIAKALNYLHKMQNQNGAIYENVYITNYYAEILQGLIAIGQDPTSEEWTTSQGKNLIDGLFILWKDNNSFDSKKGESINNRGWIEATWKALNAINDLKAAGYGEYVIKGIKVNTFGNDKAEQEKGEECKVNIAIVMPENGKYVPYISPKEVTINNKKHKSGFTALGALEASTKLFEVSGDMVTSIFGFENKGLNGWMYSVNGIVPDKMANKVDVKEGDKIIWYYSMNGMKGKTPTWEEISEDKNSEKKIPVEKLSLENTTLDLEEGTEKQLQLTIIPEDATNKNVTWKSSDEKVATIDETGKIKAIKAGDTTITVTSEENEKINCQCKVTVKSKAKEQNVDAVIDKLIDECCKVIEKAPCPSNYLDVIGLSKLAIGFNKLGKEVPEQWKNGIKKAMEQMDNDYEELIIPALAIGEDPTNVIRNTNLVEKSYNGRLVNPYQWATVLLSLNSANFNIPSDAQWNEEKLINKILEKQMKDGGWKSGWLFSTSFTAHIIQALAPYYNSNSEVREAIDKAMEKIASLQIDNGTIKSNKKTKLESMSSEELCNVIIALCELGIDPTKDQRFIKNGHNLIDGLLIFRTEDKTGIKDIYINKKGDLYSTSLALRALAAYKNLKAGKGSIYKFDFTEKEKTVDGVTLDKTYLKLEPKLRENVYLSESFSGKLTATVTQPGAKNKNVKWSSSNENIAKVDQNGNVEAVSKGKATITVTTEENNKTATCEVEVTPWDYDGHIKDNCIPKIQQRFIFFDGISDWSSLALNKSGKQWYLTNAKGTDKTTIKRLTEEVKENENKASDTDNERRTLAILACGGDPTNVDGVNLIKKIYNSQDMSAINLQVFAVLALDAGQFNIPKNSNWNQEKLIRRILASQANGGWMYGGTDKSPADPDMTAMTLSALAPYYKTNKFEDKDLNEAINKSVDDALKALQDLQVDNGGFKSWNVENCESSAMVIIALCDLGIDPLKDERFIKNGKSPLDALLTHIIPEGNGFDHISNEYFNKMSSEQGLNALTAYINFKENKGSIYKFDFKEKDPEFKVENLTKTEEIKLGQPAKITMKATNNGKEEKETTLIVGVYDNNNKLVDSYVAPKNTVKANGTANLEGTVKIPTSGQYKVKAFIWDNLEEMNSLWEDIEFNVK